MANTREVSVGAPDDLGLREVLIDGNSVGGVWSDRELKRLLSREGVEDGHPIHWLGGDATVWPDRAWMRRTTGFFVVVGLVATSYPLFRIGISDSGNALTYGGRIAGLTIILVAVAELVAAAAAVDFWETRRWRYSGVAVLLGVIIALLCGISVLLLQIGERFTAYTVIGIALVVWSSVVLIELFKCRAGKGLRIPKNIAIGVIISTLLAGANLAYAQIYVPYVTTPLIQTGAEFKESTMDKAAAKLYVTVHLHVKNAGQVPVYVLGSTYWIKGEPASSTPPDKKSRSELIYDGEFVKPDGHVLNPGEEVAQDAVIEVKDPDPRKYEAISAQSEVYVIRKDRMKMTGNYERARLTGQTLRNSLKEGDPPHPKYKFRTSISNSSEVLNVTRGPQCVTVWRLGGKAPLVIVDVSPPDTRIRFDPERPPLDQTAIERYGLSQVRGAMAQTPYRELLEKAGSTEMAETPSPTPPSPSPPPPAL
ncbi:MULTISPECIES: hypothetical protein [unclassified Streptomyces]|uniref:hypothetical protein n=1 Tax=unclassified Streptomyces TaxID=2593676 RepID=UPI0004BD56D7|nr:MULTISPECIES: hypothetical protein [unclassified Streptomyces]